MRIPSIISVIALTAGALGMMSPTAQADTSCPSGEVCLYKDLGYAGQMFVVPTVAGMSCVKDLANSKFPDGSSVDNAASSLKNNTGSVLFIYQHADRPGIYTGISAWEWVEDLRIAPAPAVSGTVDLNERVSRAC
ncbi:peptidase inhibitor family I36 protein [Streptomyces sp. NPDC000618]